MAELGEIKPNGTDTDLADLEWGTSLVPSTPEIITPAPSKRSSGWVDDEEPPFEYFNWFWRLVAKAVVWAASWRIRAYSDLESALDTTTAGLAPLEDGHIFLVGRPAGFTQPLGAAWSQAAAAFNVVSVACDGEFVYYAQDDTVYKANRGTGVVITSRVLEAGNAVLWVFADGARVLAAVSANAGSEVFALSRVDLTNEPNFPFSLADGAQHCTSNGNVMSFCEESGDDVETFLASGSFTQLDFLEPVRRVTSDYDRLYAGGFAAGGGKIASWLGHAGAIDWSVTLGQAQDVNDMVSDGDQLFIVTNQQEIGSSNFNVEARDRETGVLNWRRGAPDETTEINATSCAVDDRWLYVAAGNIVHQLDKFDGSTVRTFDHGGAVLGLSCDGDAVFIAGASGTGAKRIRRLHRGNGSMMLIKAIGTDAFRRPFARLAIPYGER